MEFADKNYKIEDRRIIIISSKKEYYKLALASVAMDTVSSFAGWKFYLSTAKMVFGKNVFPFPIYNIDDVRNYFTFPPMHPKINTAYATCDVTPNVYIPLFDFHNYFTETKHSSLKKLCADLGAKAMYLEYSEIDKEIWKFDTVGNDIPTNLGNVGIGLNINQNNEKNRNGIQAFTFLEKNNKIKNYSSPWLETEPSWKNMVDLRKENYMDTIKVDFNYTEDFGIDIKLSGTLSSIGINIGGEFKKYKEIKLKYNVTFWE